MSPVELVLQRLPEARPTGDRRWRCACPAHGGRNASTLSVGESSSGAVLLTCWAGCSVEQITVAIGLDVGDLFPARESSAGPLQRRRMLSAQQALVLLHHEALVVFVVGSDMARNRGVPEADWARLKTAVERIQHIGQEAMS